MMVMVMVMVMINSSDMSWYFMVVNRWFVYGLAFNVFGNLISVSETNLGCALTICTFYPP